MNMNQLVINPREHQKASCAYEVLDAETKERIYVGASKASELLKLTQLYANPAFDIDKPIIVNLLSYHTSYTDASAAATIYVREQGMPQLNKTAHLNRYGLVRCNETGIVYRNATVACERLGLDKSRMSQHLSRTAGHRSIKGFTFSYVNFYGDKDKIDLKEIVS